MNITEFAEQIVFSNSLQEKLAAPGKLSFDRFSSSKLPSAKSLRTPGRPASLRMQHDPGNNVQPPGDDQLEDETARGQLLHFLANHELLATELMALVLLKFPNADRKFRQGVLVTLQEEQLHTRMYLDRMRECGVEFGSYPVSGQFWRIVEPMQSPLDFVSRLSLTFEQANLDYSLHFASVFERIGDAKTASLLQRIYEDEIAHVQHGLHWFRQWKDPGQSDFDAWQTRLAFPMSPARARGPRAMFNREGRRRAGLKEDFIDAVEISGQSKDRASVVRWFNPAAEAALAGDSDPRMDQVAGELEYVMIALCKPDDVLLVRNLPSTGLRKHWVDAGLPLPEFCHVDDLESLQSRKLHRAEPWAWTPNSRALLAALDDSLRHSMPPWSHATGELYRKSWANASRLRWLDTDVTPQWMADKRCAGVAVGKRCSLTGALSQIRERGFETAVYKPDLSASGRGMHRIETRSKMEKSFHHDVEGIVEPFLDRIVDLSFLWNLSQSGAAKFLGWTRALVSKGGRYEATVLGNPFSGCDVEIRQFLLENRCERLKATANWLEKHLLPELRRHSFCGNFGVDAFVYRSKESKLKIRPFVELNPRTTMGHVALALQKKVAPGSRARFRILTRSRLQQWQCQSDSVPFEFAADGRWKSGVLWLAEQKQGAKLIPCVTIENSVHEKNASR